MLNRFARFSLAISEIDRCWHKLAAEEMSKYELNSPHAVYLTTLYDYADGITAAKLGELCCKNKKGGPCSAVAAFGANLLQLKPCINVKNGAMGVGKKYRGKFEKVLMGYVAERLVDKDDIDLDRVFVTHAGCDPKIVAEIAEAVKNTLPFKEVFVTRAGCTISSHCGANTLCVLLVRKTSLV